MVHRTQPTPRSCDFLEVMGTSDIEPSSRFLVWLIDDRDTVVVRAAADVSSAVRTARAHCAAWGARVQYIEGPDGRIVDRADWEPSMTGPHPLPYVYTVELRSPRATGRDELVSALWTSTDLDEALRWRDMLPDDLRGRSLVVSNAPDGHYPTAP
ncbi:MULTISPECIES: hypothetical protein [unclassified Rhodococcus (in: high G+C Gram-positive bacteria)]|uniref:hypothetical protein n=1 Tax=unclassified Rhodococcus (in: high G+C Gram-positive bacteria) TaxID=192944 RepID=UPI0012E372B8|nr:MULTISPECIES: hypothetical protein [unclassified Rhodococcus (in: high G+C Gram-positive bacteria)]